jgi:glycosyltransferase involved in cell wall biosynthesis
MRRAGRVVVETRTLGKRLVAGGYVVRRGALRFAPDGVDRARFRPLDRIEARRALGLALDRRALVYVGSIDHYHDLFPAIAACATTPAPGIDLHVLGDGIDRAAAEAAAARAGAPVRFHGRIPPEAVPGWIAAADLCLAPYRLEAFPGGEITFSTLKVREYLACGRPVATVPGEATGDLVREGESGFLLPNRADAWSALLARLPGRDGLDAMGLAAAATPIPSWDDVAGVYLDACEEAIAGSRGRARATRE